MYSYADIFFVAGMTWGIVACALILIALFFVRSGNILMHKRVMLLMLGGGWAFVLFYLVGYLFDQSYSKSAPSYFLPWLAAHGVVALLTLLTVTLLIWARLSAPEGSWAGDRATDDRLILRSTINRYHRLIGAITALLWLITQTGGFINLYILR